MHVYQHDVLHQRRKKRKRKRERQRERERKRERNKKRIARVARGAPRGRGNRTRMRKNVAQKRKGDENEEGRQ